VRVVRLMLQDQEVAHPATLDDGLAVRAVIVSVALARDVAEEVVHGLRAIRRRAICRWARRAEGVGLSEETQGHFPFGPRGSTVSGRQWYRKVLDCESFVKFGLGGPAQYTET
jgi:hypothetical protein